MGSRSLDTLVLETCDTPSLSATHLLLLLLMVLESLKELFNPEPLYLPNRSGDPVALEILAANRPSRLVYPGSIGMHSQNTV